MDANKYWDLVKKYDEFKRIDYAPLSETLSSYSSIASTIRNGEDLAKDLLEMQHIIGRRTVKKLDKKFQEEIRKYEIEFIQQSYRYYDSEMKFDDYAHINQYYTDLHLPVAAKEIIEGKINLAIKWQYPGMELSPGINHFTDKLVGLDPLYIVDKHSESLINTKNKFNDAYQRRLRTYHAHGDVDFRSLPVGQMGLIFSFGFFERLPLDVIKIYLTEFKKLLRPDGRVIMSYNNCLLKSSLDNTIFKKYRLFNTRDYIEPLVYGLGFDNISTTDIEPNISILEFTQPGEFYTQRAGQTLGNIKKTY